MNIRIRVQTVVDGVLVNPVLPKNFDDTRNEDRPESHQKWWNLAYIETEIREEGNTEWRKIWPSGVRYSVYCLDGGAWDRPTLWGAFATVEEAVRCAKGGIARRSFNRSVPDHRDYVCSLRRIYGLHQGDECEKILKDLGWEPLALPGTGVDPAS